MEKAVTIIEDLFHFNYWAQGRLFRLCNGLSDAQLDEKREMGFGSLRNTIFHVLTAEQIWLERWRSAPWRPFPIDAEGMSLDEMEEKLDVLYRTRQELIETESVSCWSRVIDYRDSRGNSYSQPLRPLLLHVANHGTHHRAQELNYLRGFGRTVAVGLDYLIYKLARPAVEQTASACDSLRQYGLEIDSGPGRNVIWDADIVQFYFDYHDWATDQILSALENASVDILDRPFSIGLGSIRKNLTHLLDTELWWQRNWNCPSSYAAEDSCLSIDKQREQWQHVRLERKTFIQSLNDESSQNTLEVSFGGPSIKIRIVESLIQLCTHGTHHRAQLVNMLRHSQIKPPDIDVMVWSR